MSTYNVTAITGKAWGEGRQRAKLVTSTDGPLIAFESAMQTLRKIRKCVEPCVQLGITHRNPTIREQRVKKMIERLDASKEKFTVDSAGGDRDTPDTVLLIIEPLAKREAC
jgi:hypothetical protein